MKRGLLAVALLACSSVPPDSSVGVADDAGVPLLGSVSLLLVDNPMVVVRGETTTIHAMISTVAPLPKPITLELGSLPTGLSSTPLVWHTGDAPLVGIDVTASTDAPIAQLNVELRAVVDANIVTTATGRLTVSNVVGSLDPTFGDHGVLQLPSVPIPIGIARTASGDFVIGGYDVATQSVVLTRIHADGTTDASFAQNGVGIFQPSIGTNGVVSMAEAGDDRIALGVTGSISSAVMTFDASGAPLATVPVKVGPIGLGWDGDALFVGGAQGVAYIDASQQVFTTTSAVANVNCLQVVAPSTALVGGGSKGTPGVTKYVFTNGTFAIDTTYGQSGGVATGQPVVALAMDSSGNALSALGGINTNVAVARITSGGVLDATYGSGGVTTIGPSSSMTVGLALTPASDVIFATTVPVKNAIMTNALLITRLLPSGALDANFGAYGTTVTPLGTGSNGTALALDQSSSRAYVTGMVAHDSATSGYVARYRLTP